MHDPNAFQKPGYPPNDPASWYREPFYPPAYAPQASSVAIASLVCGILAWTAAPVLCAFVAIATGHMALGEIRRDPQRVSGRGMAVVGMILGYVQLILIALVVAGAVLFFAVAIPRSLEIRETVQVPDSRSSEKVPGKTIGASGDEIERRVAATIAPIAKMPAENIDATDLLAQDLRLQDADRIDLIVALEREFRIKLRPGESQEWKTVADVAASIRRREPKLGNAELESAEPTKTAAP